ncbi:hypothetical protein [Amycolatopsis magusensis]|uniref:hypothetical protein n=1 Tax=Amycolatopsis magusensis TaxID=882444 RepID=UPI0037AAB9F2
MDDSQHSGFVRAQNPANGFTMTLTSNAHGEIHLAVTSPHATPTAEKDGMVT